MFAIRLERPLCELAFDPIAALERGPLTTLDTVRPVRDLLRHGGFKPAGRSKPASEYLAAAFAEDRFPRISTAAATAWYRELVAAIAGARVEDVAISAARSDS